MYSGGLVPSTTCLEITTSLTSSRPGRSNMIASRMLSMIDRSPRAPRLALDGLPGDRPERLFRSYTTSWFAYPLEGGIDPCLVVYPALPSRSFYWLWSSLVLALTSHDFSFGFVINDLSAIGAVRRSFRYRVPFCGGRQSSPRAAPAYALGGLLRFFLAPFSRMVFRRTFDASSRGRRLPVASSLFSTLRAWSTLLSR